MVFPSIPPYFHDPANWQQHPNQSTGGDYIVGNNSQLLQPTPPPQIHGGGGGAGTIRPGSLADRARLANIPMPEAALKCPRCESTNTKFCYFNNYSLTQPRHFCKTCRRYWTRGGSMRNVPVGGGCRRNRRNSKGTSRSKSPVSSNSDRQMGTNSSSSSINTTSNAIGSSTADILGLTQQIPPSLGYMTGLNSTNLTEFPSNEIGLNYGLNNIGLISQQMGGSVGDLNFQLGTGFGGHGASGSYLSASGVENLRPPSQFPFLASLDSPLGGFESGIGIESSGYEVRPKPATSGLTQQMASVKMEENQLNLSRQFLGMAGNEQYWSGTAGGATSSSTSTTAWTNLSGYSPFSATTNPL